MRRHLDASLILVVLALPAMAWPQPTFGWADSDSTRSGSRLLREAYEHALQDSTGQRDIALKEALATAPEHPPVRWATGHVRFEDRWVRFDEVVRRLAGNDALAEYRQLREKQQSTVEGQLRLADWCAKHDLPDQERAHLMRALQIDPDESRARARLGFKRVEGVWLSRQEMRDSAQRAQAASQALKKWTPEMKQILLGLGQRNEAKRREAEQRLLAINDPAAILAMESALCSANEQAAKLSVQAMAQMPQPEASVALARQAAFSSWPSVSAAAADALKPRPEDSYVPTLLSGLTTRVSSRYELFTAPNGRLHYEHAFYREGENQRELLVLQNTVRFRHVSGREADANSIVAASARRATGQAITADLAARETAVNEQNYRIAELNGRIGDVLTRITGVQLPHDSHAWWKWWTDHNGIIVLDDKPIEVAVRREESERRISEEARRSETGFQERRRCECLVAGTPVWTERGPLAIEQIQPGDLVLSQHPTTGELAYRPVLRATQRPAGPVRRISAGPHVIRCSLGHPFWVAGQRWVRASNLEVGMRLYGLNGMTVIDAVADEEKPVETFNLIVDEAHSYFVSDALILSHDNTIRRPTTGPLPGLTDQ